MHCCGTKEKGTVTVIPNQKKALLIGINYFNTPSELNGCINDVLRIREWLIKCDYAPENIVMLTDNVQIGKSPTKANILAAFVEFTKGATATSCLYVHYSGHGTQLRNTDGTETDGYDEAICPVDYNSSGMITDNELRTHLADALPRGCQLICVLDCCHSGTGMDLRFNYTSSDISATETSYTLRQDKKYQPTKGRVCVLSGCRDNQTSADAWISGKYQGAMTCAVMTVIDENKNKISWQRLIREVRRWLQRSGYSQVAQLSFGTQMDLKKKFQV